MENKGTTEELILLAKEASKKAYAPYSNFPVGAAISSSSGDIFFGCNVENLAFPSGLCAERTAIVKAVSMLGPSLKIKTVVVYTPTDRVTTPCGACRQVIEEFVSEHTQIISVCDGDEVLSVPFRELFPAPTRIDKLSE